jgi:hypothetical protein
MVSSGSPLYGSLSLFSELAIGGSHVILSLCCPSLLERVWDKIKGELEVSIILDPWT